MSPDRQNREIRVSTICWRGMTVEISFEANWLNCDNSVYQTAHLQVRTIMPKDAPLPITETGYRSHFIHASFVEDAGGPEAFAVAWLDHEAATPAWLEQVARSRQLSLF